MVVYYAGLMRTTLAVYLAAFNLCNKFALSTTIPIIWSKSRFHKANQAQTKPLTYIIVVDGKNALVCRMCQTYMAAMSTLTVLCPCTNYRLPEYMVVLPVFKLDAQNITTPTITILVKKRTSCSKHYTHHFEHYTSMTMMMCFD